MFRRGLTAAAVLGIAAAPLALNAADSPKVGFLMSDYTTSARWQFDRDFFIAALKKLDPGVEVVADDAKTDQTRQQTQAASLLTSGAKLLIDVPVDSTQASAIVRVDHVNSGTLISIAGAQTDNNAIEFHAGAMQVLDPLVKSGRYKMAYDRFTPNWDNNAAQAETASALNNLGNKVDGILVANDGMAGGVVAALRAQHLDGKVVVTGQDATVAGIQNILTGEQSMTIYKPIRKLAEAAAAVTDAYLKGQKPKTDTTTKNGKIDVPTVLLPVVTVTKDNIKSTVIADGFVTKEQLCNGIPASACSGL